MEDEEGLLVAPQKPAGAPRFSLPLLLQWGGVEEIARPTLVRSPGGIRAHYASLSPPPPPRHGGGGGGLGGGGGAGRKRPKQPTPGPRDNEGASGDPPRWSRRLLIRLCVCLAAGGLFLRIFSLYKIILLLK